MLFLAGFLRMFLQQKIYVFSEVMGLLSDPDRRINSLSVLIKYANVLCVVVYLLNFVTFLALFHPLLRERTYFSENALLANQVDLTYSNELLAVRMEKELKDMGNAKRNMPRIGSSQSLKEWAWKLTDKTLQSIIRL